MSISTNTPQIEALKKAVEDVLGTSLRTHNAFINLVCIIENAQSEHISESTLERLWGYSTRDCESISCRTLDVLSRFVGSAGWEDFCRQLKENSIRESEELVNDGIDVSSLEKGDRLRISWLPDRVIDVLYLGNFRFEIISSLNSSLSARDSFSCLQICRGRELYMEKFRRTGSDEEKCYAAGQDHGITSIIKV